MICRVLSTKKIEASNATNHIRKALYVDERLNAFMCLGVRQVANRHNKYAEPAPAKNRPNQMVSFRYNNS